jgi:uncharacterized membrane protein
MNKLTRRLAIALAVSAALNIFLAGFVAARLLLADRPCPTAGPRGEGPHSAGPRNAPGVRAAEGATEPMRRLMHKRHDRFRPRQRALRDARQRVARALQAEPFDSASLETALAGLRQATAESQEAIHAMLVETAGSLTPQQRRNLSGSRLLRLPGSGPGSGPPRRGRR